jgi:hypothetical protein
VMPGPDADLPGSGVRALSRLADPVGEDTVAKGAVAEGTAAEGTVGVGCRVCFCAGPLA